MLCLNHTRQKQVKHVVAWSNSGIIMTNCCKTSQLPHQSGRQHHTTQLKPNRIELILSRGTVSSC